MHKWDMASVGACDCGAKEQTAEQVIILPHLTHFKWSLCSLRCRQEPDDLSDENILGHLADITAPFNPYQMKKKQLQLKIKPAI